MITDLCRAFHICCGCIPSLIEHTINKLRETNAENMLNIGFNLFPSLSGTVGNVSCPKIEPCFVNHVFDSRAAIQTDKSLLILAHMLFKFSEQTTVYISLCTSASSADAKICSFFVTCSLYFSKIIRQSCMNQLIVQVMGSQASC